MPYLSTMKHRDALWICKLRKEKVSKMKKKFAIILALFLIAVVCSAGCIDPETPVNPVDPVVPVDPVDPVTPVDPVVPEEPEEPVDPVVPAEGDFTVTFMMNSAVDSGVYLTVYVDEGEAVAEPAVPEKPKAQYIFVQWTTDKENKHAYDFTSPVTANLVLYADWDVKGTSSGSGHSHSYTATVTTEATCGANGVKTYTCSCGASYTEVILATENHSYGTWASGQKTCSVCGDVVTCEHPTTALSGTNIVCTVCNKDLGAVAAQIDTNYYTSFASAMENAAADNTIKLLAPVTDGEVNKKVVIDTNNNATTLKYDTEELTVDDIKIKKDTATAALSVTFGEEEVVFKRNADSSYAADSDGNLIVAYTKNGSTYTIMDVDAAQSVLNFAGKSNTLVLSDGTYSSLVIDYSSVTTSGDGQANTPYSTIRDLGDFTISGSGENTVLNKFDINEYHLTYFDGRDGAGGAHVSGDSGYEFDTLTIKNLKITSQFAFSDQRITADKIVFENVIFDCAGWLHLTTHTDTIGELEFKGCTFINGGSAEQGIHLVAYCETSTKYTFYEGCTFSGAKRQIMINGDTGDVQTGKITIAGCTFENTDSERAIRMNLVKNNEILITGNTFVNAANGGGEIMKISHTDSTIIFTGNTKDGVNPVYTNNAGTAIAK